MTLPVAADIESVCSKCGIVWHVVVAKVGDKIAKVQCKQCGGFHRYKSPHPVEKTTRSAAAKTTKKKTSSKRGKAEPPPPPEPDLSRPIQPYKMTTKFEVGDRVQHATFGLGVVEELPGPGKMQVCFSEGRKLLIHGREQP
jgi:hypothetical protein